MKRWRVIIASLALAVGAAAGWFAAGAWGERKCGNVELWKCGNVETANVGRARSPSAPDGRVCRSATAAAGESKASEAELAALRDKAAGLETELKELLDSRGRKAKAEAQKKGGEDSKKDGPEVSEDEALCRCDVATGPSGSCGLVEIGRTEMM